MRFDSKITRQIRNFNSITLPTDKKKDNGNSNKNSGSIIRLLNIHDKFKALLKKETIDILSDVNNYTDSLECKVCHNKILNTKIPNYFHLYTEDQAHFITFHFICALKPNSVDKFHEVADYFDYTYHINNKDTIS